MLLKGPRVVPEIIDDNDLKEEVLEEPGETQPRTRGIVHLSSETQIDNKFHLVKFLRLSIAGSRVKMFEPVEGNPSPRTEPPPDPAAGKTPLLETSGAVISPKAPSLDQVNLSYIVCVVGLPSGTTDPLSSRQHLF